MHYGLNFRFFAMINCVSISAVLPLAIFKNCKLSGVPLLAFPLALFEGTETEARLN